MNTKEILTQIRTPGFLSSNVTIKKKHVVSCIASILLAIYFTLVSYPGVFYSDSYVRWEGAQTILSGYFSGVSSWVSITPQLFMAILFAMTYNYASYTLIQAFLFFLTSFILIDKLARDNKFIVAILFTLCPIFYGYSVYLEMSVGCVIGINCGILLLLTTSYDNYIQWKVSKKVLFFSGLFLSFYVAFGFRQNAFTVLPAIFLLVIYFYKKHRKKAIAFIQLLAICLSLIFVSIVPTILGIPLQDSSGAGFVWEILSTIQLMPEEKQEEYSAYLDFLSVDGSTKEALKVNDSYSVNPWLWTVYTPQMLNEKDHSSQVKSHYVQLLMKEPQFFIKNKVNFILNTMGIRGPIRNAEYDYNRWDALQKYGMYDNPLRFNFVAGYNNFQNNNPIFRMPFIWFFIGFIVILCESRNRLHDRFQYLPYLFLVALFYYGAFLVNTQSIEFRYFFPSFYYLFLVILVGMLDILYMLFRAIKHKYFSESIKT